MNHLVIKIKSLFTIIIIITATIIFFNEEPFWGENFHIKLVISDALLK